MNTLSSVSKQSGAKQGELLECLSNCATAAFTAVPSVVSCRNADNIEAFGYTIESRKRRNRICFNRMCSYKLSKRPSHFAFGEPFSIRIPEVGPDLDRDSIRVGIVFRSRDFDDVLVKTLLFNWTYRATTAPK